MVGSFAAGLLAAVLLVAAPFVPATEAGITGAVLCGLALGWTGLALLSARTGRPQPWAVAPALFHGVSGLLLVAFGPPVHEVLARVWPPATLALVVWIIVRARRQLPGRSRRWLLHPVLAALALASVGGGYQIVHEIADTSAAMPGRLIDVGGHRLHLSCTGSGSPTVVLEPGAGGSSSTLDLLTPAVARDTRVCVYDRAGRGWSEPATTPQHAGQIATDLHTVLQRGGVAGPYVLAGHSFGGLYALTFTARYPDEVAGMVLVDSTAPAAAAGPTATPAAAGGSSDLMDRVSILVSSWARLGLGRLIGTPTTTHLRSTIDEYGLGGTAAQHAAALRDFGDKPLVVLTAGVGLDAEKAAAQRALVTLSTDGTQRVVDGVGHSGMLGEQEGAAATTRAVRDVLSAVRAGRPVAD